jgi:ssDNA-binding Zn-finger/Zn-ribbon topoisomerase 1
MTRVNAAKRAWKCGNCQEDLVMKKTVFSYLGQTVAHEAPTCPKCGKVLITEELAEGKMAEVEEQIEDK